MVSVKVNNKEEKLNWHWYICRGCNRDGNARMISLQARLELCDLCYKTLPEEWRRIRGGEVKSE